MPRVDAYRRAVCGHTQSVTLSAAHSDACVCIHMHTYVYVCMCVLVCIDICKLMHKLQSTRPNAPHSVQCTWRFARVFAYGHVYERTHTHTHTYIAGSTPLHAALSAGHVDVVQVMLDSADDEVREQLVKSVDAWNTSAENFCNENSAAGAISESIMLVSAVRACARDRLQEERKLRRERATRGVDNLIHRRPAFSQTNVKTKKFGAKEEEARQDDGYVQQGTGGETPVKDQGAQKDASSAHEADVSSHDGTGDRGRSRAQEADDDNVGVRGGRERVQVHERCAATCVMASNRSTLSVSLSGEESFDCKLAKDARERTKAVVNQMRSVIRGTPKRGENIENQRANGLLRDVRCHGAADEKTGQKHPQKESESRLYEYIRLHFDCTGADEGDAGVWDVDTDEVQDDVHHEEWFNLDENCEIVFQFDVPQLQCGDEWDDKDEEDQ
jgi:hypothetical protein